MSRNGAISQSRERKSGLRGLKFQREFSSCLEELADDEMVLHIFPLASVDRVVVLFDFDYVRNVLSHLSEECVFNSGAVGSKISS